MHRECLCWKKDSKLTATDVAERLNARYLQKKSKTRIETEIFILKI